ncbi:MAG: ABC transporter ATP-binding protein [archaeon]|nr:ABC transporter ATP-binding protein [archaeon]
MLLSVESLSASYGNIRVLWDVSIKVEKGEIVALLGANGAGKSTLLRCIMGLVRFHDGDVVFDSQSIKRVRPHAIVQRGIAYVAEGRRLFGAMTVEDNLRMGAPRKCDDLKARMDLVYSLFPALSERKEQNAATLSGGEQQMVAIGRALTTKPKMLLLDELSFGLAPKMFERVLKSIQEANLLGVSILMAEQNSERALQFSSRAYIMENGRISVEGKSQDLINDPRVKEAYLGLAD